MEERKTKEEHGGRQAATYKTVSSWGPSRSSSTHLLSRTTSSIVEITIDVLFRDVELERYVTPNIPVYDINNEKQI